LYSSPIESLPKSSVLKTMVALYPWLENYLAQPTHHYAERIFRPGNTTKCETRGVAFEKLLRCLEVSAINVGHSTEHAAAIRDDFAVNRVLQTGPHLMLVLDPEAYTTHAFSLLGLQANGCRSYVSYAVSTVKLEERARKGPAWLTVAGRPLSIFPLSRNQMIPYSLLSRFEGLHFQKELVGAEDQSRSDGETKSLLPQGTFERPSHALKAANQALWPKVFGRGFSFLQIDDEDIADLCIQHLLDENSWLRTKFFGNMTLAISILAEIDALAHGPWYGLLTRSTDFFWHYDGGKRLPLRLAGQQFVDPSTGRNVACFSADEIVELLAKRTLIPNLFLMFLLTAILPGVRVLGGSRHPLYYPLIRYVLCRALRATASDDTLERQLAADRLPCAWGHRIIECKDVSLTEILDEDHGWLTALWADRQPLVEACGPMTGFTSDGRWAELFSQIEEKRIRRSDPQWGYSG
jgi:hypothetical protein